MSFGSAAINAITMTLWAFLGMESACANADAVDNPETNVPKAVLGGTLIAAACYIVSTNIIFGIIPSEDLVSSSAPFGLVFGSHVRTDRSAALSWASWFSPASVPCLAGSSPLPTYSRQAVM